MEFSFALLSDDKTVEKIKDIVFEMAKMSNLIIRFQRILLRDDKGNGITIYVFKISNIYPQLGISENSIDYIAILKKTSIETQEILSRILRDGGIIVFPKRIVDASIFINKAPSIIDLGDDKDEYDVIARIVSDISKLLMISRSNVIKILRTVVKEEDENTRLIEAYRMVTRR